MERFPISPISADWVARQTSSCDELSAFGGELWFIQSDPDLAGAKRLMRCRPGERPKAVSPAGVEIGSWLHAYGGGAYVVTDAGVWFVNEEDSSVCLLDPAKGSYRSVVPPGNSHVYGDLSVSPFGILAVREAPACGDQIVEITSDGRIRVLIDSSGFLAAPALRGNQLAYLTWEANRMPWDESRLHLTSYDALVTGEPARTVAGGTGESITEPQWGPDGALYFLSDRTGWWNLYSWQPQGAHQVLSVDQDCCPAPWEGGYRSYGFLSDGSIVVTIHDGFSVRLAVVSRGGKVRDLALDITSIKPYVAVAGQRLAVIGSSPSRPPTVRVVDLSSAEPEPRFDGADLDVGSGHTASTATVREVEAEGHTVQFLLRRAAGSSDEPAPLLVRAHPGPTDNVPLRLDWAAEFFVSRGFAVADVLYRGSSGLGRSYRQALYSHWGEYDVQDCVIVAHHLLAKGVARPGAVFVTGASAGGYTALQAARDEGTFAAATAVSAITNPKRWSTTAPRFQQAYAAMLGRPDAEVRATDVSIPVLLIHGANDPVAPVEDARQLAKELKEAGKEYETLFLDGGGHFLSDPVSRAAALTAEAEFYAKFIKAEA
jgi:dipeptidyl aminopeptidase/acylaminoacyl peptidase